ncbi:MAG: protein kinase [Phycisphaerales bacterium]|nr:MAG: protein kinase [Phycisphaerales bacterium]
MGTEGPNPEEILQKAVEIINPAERAAYLEQACGGDGALRAEIESLLKAHQEAGTFLDAPALDREVTLATAGPMEGPGTVIGRFKLLEQIGEGGMATVYMAEQERPVRRKVALKIVKLGMDTKSVIARFEAERQALALMDHPNIAKVLDGGATETGRPYFVMELVRGIAITEYCDKNKLNTQNRLELFIQVCSAVQHAHHKGIIHRDIKPSNVLVTLRDGVPVPKVIDFGIAKATNQRLTEKTVFTRFAQMIGTPEYMSPEQAEMSELDVDTRTDIYALGVLLYELLTGSTPFDPDQLRQAGYAGIQRIIRETEPPKPSTKLSTLGLTLIPVAQHRQTTPEMLPRLVRGDLDWIVMKTLEKDRTHRYETAHALGEDIQRHLKHEPITAGRPGSFHRCKKFVQRHRALVTGTVAVLVVLCAGIGVSTYLALWQRRTVRQLKKERVTTRRLENERRLSASRRLYEKGHYQDALVEVEFYWDGGGNEPEARLIHARSLFSLNEVQAAIDELEDLIAQSPDPQIAGRAHHLLGIFLAEIDSRRAQEHRRLGGLSLPKTAEDCYLRAKTVSTLVESVEWLSRALGFDPSYYPARKSRALACYGLRDFEGMKHDAEVLIVCRPKDSLGYALRAIVRRRRGLFEEAIHDHNLAIRLCQTTSALAELHNQRRATWARAGEHLAELRDAKQCAELDPVRLGYQFNVFAALVRLNDYEAATKKYNAILDMFPESKRQFIERAQKYVFDTLGAGEALDLPEEVLSEPIFSIMQEAIESYRSLSAKAGRLLPIMSARMSWSPDSRYLAYGRSERYVSDLGMHSTPVEFLSSGVEILDLQSGNARLLVSFGKDPAWSPDGEYIAFVRGPIEYGDATEEIWIVPAYGGTPRQIAMGGYPYWTADSKQVVFQSRIDNTLCAVDVSDPNAESEVIMVYHDWYPVVSPDGRYAAYYLDHELTIQEIPSGSVFMRCSIPIPPGTHMMTWSPDGKELSLGHPDTGLWVFDLERQQIRQVLDGPVFQGVWSPDRSKMGIRLDFPYAEIWLATLDPQKPTSESLTPALTWDDYMQFRCERCRRLVSGCPKQAEERLAELTALGVGQFRAGRYQDTVLALKAVDELRQVVLRGQARAVEIGFLAKALHKLNRRGEADACLAQLRELFRRRRLIHGQTYFYDAEKTLASQDDRGSQVWRDLEMGQLADVARKLSSLRSEEPHDASTTQWIEGLCCALAMQYCFRARGEEAESDAVADYRAAIQSDPNYAPAFRDLAWLQATCPDPNLCDRAKAIENATRACELTHWEDHALVNTLAAIHAMAGDFDVARERQRQAIALLESDEDKSLRDLYLGNLRLYQLRRNSEETVAWGPCAENLVAWWTFNEGQGPVARDAKGANDGALHGDPVWTAGGILGALQFDGVGDYVDCGHSSLFDITGEITVASWIRVTTFDAPVQAVVTKGDSAWRLHRPGGGSSLGFHCNLQSGSSLVADGTKPVDDGNWHHVAGIFDGNETYLYLDGVLNGNSGSTRVDGTSRTTTSSEPSYIATNAFSLWIGDNSEAPGNEWCGLIDEVRIYDCALDANDVAALAQTYPRKSSTCSGLVSYWPGEENTLDTVGANHIVAGGVAAPTFTPGAIGKAFHFDDSSARVVAPAHGIGDLQQFTMALWVRLDSLRQGESASFLCLGREKAVLRCDGGPLHFYTRNAENDFHHIWAKDVLVEGVFHHVAGTYDGRAMRLYLDGVEAGTCLTVGTLTTEADNGVEFGQDNLDGLLDEIQIYSRALSASEIADLARASSVPTPTLIPRGRYEASDDVGKMANGQTRRADTAVEGAVGDAPVEDNMEDCVQAPAVGIDDLLQFSIALWVKLNSMIPGQIQEFVASGAKATLRYDGGAGERQLHFYMQMTDQSWGHIRANHVLNAGVFHHAVGTYDGHAMRLFLDGALIGTCTPSSLSVHGEGVSLGWGLCGVLDEVQVYDRPLSGREVKELYSSNDTATLTAGAGPVTWWCLDETSGTTAYDCVGSNHGTVHGAAWTDGKVGGALRFGRPDSAAVQ